MARRSMLDEQEEATEINLSPMIDCIFILLIFFIVTTVFVEEKERVVLEITAENRVLLGGRGGREVGMGEIPDLVKSGVAGGEETPVVIRAHERSDHGVFVAVWDAARRGGAGMLTFNTVN